MATSDVTLNFPNPSRTYDDSRHCVCFFDPRNLRKCNRCAAHRSRSACVDVAPSRHPEK
jgi:hypothetical protein